MTRSCLSLLFLATILAVQAGPVSAHDGADNPKPQEPLTDMPQEVVRFRTNPLPVAKTAEGAAAQQRGEPTEVDEAERLLQIRVRLLATPVDTVLTVTLHDGKKVKGPLVEVTESYFSMWAKPDKETRRRYRLRSGQMMKRKLPFEKVSALEGAAELDLTQKYLLIALGRGVPGSGKENQTSKMQQLLTQVAVLGFRLRAGVGPVVLLRSDARAVLLLEKLEAGEPYEYTVTSKEDGLNAWGTKGFRVVPSAVSTLPDAIMERAPGATRPYKYRILATQRTGTLEKELQQATQQGYEVVGLTFSVGERVLLLEAPGAAQEEALVSATEELQPEASQYLLLSTSRTSAMQEELTSSAADGYRLLAASDAELLFVLDKNAASAETPEYLLLATERTSTLEKELNEGAQRGYRLHPRTLGLVEKKPLGGLVGTVQSEVFAAMEKSASQTGYEYRLATDTHRISTLQKKLTEAVEKGFKFAAMSGADRLIVVLERPK